MTYDARAIANYFLDLAKRRGVPLTPMKLQKLIYFAHGWSLGVNSKPLVADPIQAWQYGPVIASVYREFKHFGSGVISSHARDFEPETLEFTTPSIAPDDVTTKALLNKVWNVYGAYTAAQLSNLSHVKDGPWAKARAGKDDDKQVVINDDLIKEYFDKLAERNKAEAA